MNIVELEMKMKALEKKIIEEESRKKILEDNRDSYLSKKKKIEDRIDLLNSVNILLQKTSSFAREQSKKQIEQLTTNCMQFIFDNNSKFEIEIQELYGKASADFYIIDNANGLESKTRPIESRGGGLVDIISLALRISFLQLYRPLIDGPLILDEPAKHVSEEYINNVADFLKRSSEMFNRQIIMVTHNVHLASIAMNSYKVENTNNTSFVDLIISE